ncbi:hypothetical protein JVU11DRAFT_7190 [Chiua virens]|nr:hypothetical protein JVU11DRAFT_7190 [Chiua virens]
MSISTSPPKDRVYPQMQSDLPQTIRSRARSEASVFKRVSTLFGSRRRTSSKTISQTNASPAGIGIGYIHACPPTMFPRVSSDTTPQSSLEIRRPSGLGRRASLLDFGRLLEEEEDTKPTGFVSLPNLSGGGAFYSSERTFPRFSPLPARPAAYFVLAEPIFRVVLEFLPRSHLPDVALVSHGFFSAARYALYHSLDVQETAELSLEKLFNVLACKRELATLVVSFHCSSWPSWELASPDGRVTSVPSDDVRRAFQNMYHLKSLTVPSFSSILSYTPSLAFSLTHLMILDQKITQSQLATLHGWLVTQLSLESLSFPDLVEYTGTDPSLVHEWGYAVDSSKTDGLSSFTTPLPGLKSLRASTEIVSTLCLAMNNPIQHLTLDGLRPSTVIRSLNGVRDMHIIFGPEVDKRTVEKFLAVAGTMLSGKDKAEAIKSLEVEVLWTDSDAAETLYGIVTSIISRFRGLQALKLTSPFRSIQSSFPAPASISLFSPPSPAPSAALTVASSKRSSMNATTLCGSMIRKEFVACGIEQSYARAWTRHCPSLSDIQFDFSCSTTDADVELCGVWFRRKIPLSSLSAM